MTRNLNNTFAKRRPDLLVEWDYEMNIGLDPTVINCHSRKSVHWKCMYCQRKWKTFITSRVPAKGGCSSCVAKRRTHDPVLHSERIKAGLDAVRVEVRAGIRRFKLSKEQAEAIVDNVASKRNTGAQMATIYKVSQACVSQLFSKSRKAYDQ